MPGWDFQLDLVHVTSLSPPGKTRRIYESTYYEIHEKLGSGSIGPATAVASGLMAEKKVELAEVLGIKAEDRIY
jgi:hypothetical protein